MTPQTGEGSEVVEVSLYVLTDQEMCDIYILSSREGYDGDRVTMRNLGFLRSLRNLVNLTVMRGKTRCGPKNGRTVGQIRL